MNDQDNTVAKRLRVLQLAEELGNVAEACRQTGVSRTQFYEYRRRFQEQGLPGLQDRPSSPRSHPSTTSDDVAKLVIDLAVLHPEWGCGTLSRTLGETGTALSSPTIQKLLVNHGLGRRKHRVREVLRRHLEEGLDLTDDQVRVIQKHEPFFVPQGSQGSAPGSLLIADTWRLRQFPGLARLYLLTVIDTYGHYAFCELHPSNDPHIAVTILQKSVLPFYARLDVPVTNIAFFKGRAFSEEGRPSFRESLANNNIDYHLLHTWHHPVIKTFHQTMLSEFFEHLYGQVQNANLKTAAKVLRAWLRHYNKRREIHTYPNWGLCPLGTIQQYLECVR